VTIFMLVRYIFSNCARDSGAVSCQDFTADLVVNMANQKRSLLPGSIDSTSFVRERTNTTLRPNCLYGETVSEPFSTLPAKI
jgi:hypothetical protein